MKSVSAANKVGFGRRCCRAVTCFCLGFASMVIVPAFAHRCESDQTELALWLGKPIDTKLEGRLFQLFACIDTKDRAEYKLIDRAACNWFAGKALKAIWGFDDFKSSTGFLSANDIADRLASGKLAQWRSIGVASDQFANDEAASAAASNHPVVAVWKAPTGSTENGHVALILPGGVVASGWGVRVPRAAQLSLDQPNHAFIGCRVSSAFSVSKRDQVFYFSRVLD